MTTSAPPLPPARAGRRFLCTKGNAGRSRGRGRSSRRRTKTLYYLLAASALVANTQAAKGPYIYEPPAGSVELRSRKLSVSGGRLPRNLGGAEAWNRREMEHGSSSSSSSSSISQLEANTTRSTNANKMPPMLIGISRALVGRVVLKPLRRILRIVSHTLVSGLKNTPLVSRSLRHLGMRDSSSQSCGRDGNITPSSAREKVPSEHRWMLDVLDSQITPELRERSLLTHQPLDEAQLVRFLEGNHWSLEFRGGKTLAEHIESGVEWRETFGAHRIERKDLPSNLPMRVCGRDRMNRPILWCSMEALFGDGGVDDDEEFIRLCVYSLEQAWLEAKAVGATTYSIVLDCDGFGMSRLPPLRPMKNFGKLLMDFYPMRLGDILVVNVSSATLMAWKLFSGIVPARTKDKMHFSKKSRTAAATAEALNSFIEPHWVPQDLGGKLAIPLD